MNRPLLVKTGSSFILNYTVNQGTINVWEEWIKNLTKKLLLS